MYIIYTSYFANLRNIDLSQYKLFSISRFPPKFLINYDYVNLNILAPSSKLLLGYKNGDIDQDQYIEIYTRYLDSLNDNTKFQTFNGNTRLLGLKGILSQIESRSKDKSPVLLCYEKPNSFCHRFILSDYINKNYGDRYLMTEY